eukprot:250316_1
MTTNNEETQIKNREEQLNIPYEVPVIIEHRVDGKYDKKLLSVNADDQDFLHLNDERNTFAEWEVIAMEETQQIQLRSKSTQNYLRALGHNINCGSPGPDRFCVFNVHSADDDTIKLESSVFKGTFVGIQEDGRIGAANNGDLCHFKIYQKSK